MVRLPVFGICNLSTNLDPCHCTQGAVQTPSEGLHWRLTPGEKVPRRPGDSNPRQHIVWLFNRTRSTNGAIPAPILWMTRTCTFRAEHIKMQRCETGELGLQDSVRCETGGLGLQDTVQCETGGLGLRAV